MNLAEQLAILRAVVGYLGERGQHAWWQSSFLAPTSPAFLAPVFGRTQVLAQVSGVTRAAAMVHDERIGVGQVYHLFRLPEDIEQGIHRILYNPELCQQIAAFASDEQSAMAYLNSKAVLLEVEGAGPIHIGGIRRLRQADSWSVIAVHYARGFEQGKEVFPYFAERS